MSHETHRTHPARSIGVAIVTVSDTRTTAEDESGALARRLIEDAGHRVADYRILKDEPSQVGSALAELVRREDVRAIVFNGGTGISRRDTTFEAVSRMLEKRLDGFGEIFRSLSFQEIGSAAILSRAVAGTRGDRIIFSVPGSPAAVRLALERLILPELGHIIAELDTQQPAC